MIILYQITDGLHGRDFNHELSDILTLKDGAFQPHTLQLWTENLTKKSAPVEASFQAVDAEISKLDRDARESAFRQDCLKLTRDCAQLAMILKQEISHEKAVRLQKVTHLKKQNTVGANCVSQFMQLNMRHVGGRTGELEGALDEASRQKISKTHATGHFTLHPCLAMLSYGCIAMLSGSS